MSDFKSVETLYEKDYHRVEKFLINNTPFVLKRRKCDFDKDYFMKHFCNTKVKVKKYSPARKISSTSAASQLNMSLNDFFNKKDIFIADSTHTYTIQSDIKKEPELLAYLCKQRDFNVDCVFQKSFSNIFSEILWVNLKGAQAGLHYDCVDNFNYQLMGSKLFYIAPPKLLNYYRHSFLQGIHHCSAIFNIQDYDKSKFIKFEKEFEKFYKVILEAGDLLYLPHAWWHQVHSLEDININLSTWRRTARKAIRYPLQSSGAIYTRTYRKLKGV